MESTKTKRKRISKKNKSAWRKTDVQDVDDFLEDQRQQERIGTFEDKSDDALFTIDATPQIPKKSQLTERQKRKLNAKKPLRSLQMWENTSKVKDPIAKRNHVKLKKSGRNIEEEILKPTKARHIQANQDRERYNTEVEEKKKHKEDKLLKTAKDVWADEDFRDKIPGLKDEKGWVSRDLALHVAKNIGKSQIKVHDGIRNRTTKAKKFEPPHPGMSYNPSLEDHQDLIEKVVEKEEKIIKEEKHLKRVTTKMFKKVTTEERDARQHFELNAENNEEEATATATEESKVIGENNEDDDAPYKTINPPVQRENIKSKQARSKELKQKELQKRQEQKKALKKQIADLNRIKSIKAEVLNEEEELNALMKHRKQVEFKKKFETKRLGRLKFVEPDIDINMPEDITGNLRNAKPESSLLVDRFKNFQKRNIIPVSVATGKQKARKIKRFPRSSHKDPGVSFQMLREQRKAAQNK